MDGAALVRELRELRDGQRQLRREVRLLLARTSGPREDHLTTAEAVAYGVPEGTLRRLASVGRLTRVRRGRRVLWLRHELDSYLCGEVVVIRGAG